MREIDKQAFKNKEASPFYKLPVIFERLHELNIEKIPVNIEPVNYGKTINYYEIPLSIRQEIIKEAEKIDKICYAVLKNTETGNEVILTDTVCKGLAQQYVLLNATEAKTNSPAIPVIIYNQGKGKLSKYWLEATLFYKKGEIF